jgi:hypothetical protein
VATETGAAALGVNGARARVRECLAAKGRKRGRCPGFIRAERGGRGSGRGQAAGSLAIDGRRRCGIKKEVERGNRRIWRGNGRWDYDT